MKKNEVKLRIEFIEKNIALSNVELAQLLGIKVIALKIFMHRKKIKRPKDILINRWCENLILARLQRDKIGRDGNKNPNWKGGISKNNYHYKKLQIKRYPDRIRARRLVYNAIKSGRLKRVGCCICGLEKAHAHHEDYSKPLEVKWYCRKHHRELHNNLH